MSPINYISASSLITVVGENWQGLGCRLVATQQITSCYTIVDVGAHASSRYTAQFQVELNPYSIMLFQVLHHLFELLCNFSLSIFSQYSPRSRYSKQETRRLLPFHLATQNIMNNNKIPRNPKWNGKNGKNGQKVPDGLETKKITDVAIEAPARIIKPSRPHATYLPRLDSRYSCSIPSSFNKISHTCLRKFDTAIIHHLSKVQLVHAKIHQIVVSRVQTVQIVLDHMNPLFDLLMYIEPYHFQQYYSSIEGVRKKR